MDVLLLMAFYCCHRCVFRIKLVATEKIAHLIYDRKRMKTHFVWINVLICKINETILCSASYLRWERFILFHFTRERERRRERECDSASRMELFNKCAAQKWCVFGWWISMNVTWEYVSEWVSEWAVRKKTFAVYCLELWQFVFSKANSTQTSVWALYTIEFYEEKRKRDWGVSLFPFPLLGCMNPFIGFCVIFFSFACCSTTYFAPTISSNESISFPFIFIRVL